MTAIRGSMASPEVRRRLYLLAESARVRPLSEPEFERVRSAVLAGEPLPEDVRAAGERSVPPAARWRRDGRHRVREPVLAALRAGPLTAAELAAATGVPAASLRSRLAVELRRGVVETVGGGVGRRGRAVRRYRLTR